MSMLICGTIDEFEAYKTEQTRMAVITLLLLRIVVVRDGSTDAHTALTSHMFANHVVKEWAAHLQRDV